MDGMSDIKYVAVFNLDWLLSITINIIITMDRICTIIHLHVRYISITIGWQWQYTVGVPCILTYVSMAARCYHMK